MTSVCACWEFAIIEKDLKIFFNKNSSVIFWRGEGELNCPCVVQRLNALIGGSNCCLQWSCGLIMHEDPQQGVALLCLLLNIAKKRVHTHTPALQHTQIQNRECLSVYSLYGGGGIVIFKC